MYNLVEKPKPVRSFAEIQNEQQLGVDVWPGEVVQENNETEETTNDSNLEDGKEDAPINQLDEDFLLAMQLQEQLDLEEELKEQSLMSKKTTNEKVSVSKGTKKNTTKYVPVSNANILDYCVTGDEYDDYEDYDDDEEEEYEDYGKTMEKNYVGQVISSYSNQKIGNRMPKKEHMISKHDPMIDSIKKAEEINQIWEGNNLGDMNGTRISGKIFNNLKKFNERDNSRKTHKMSKDEYESTVNDVIDQRTRVAIFKMTNSILKQMNGCISTGKEASVFHGQSTDEETFKYSTNPKEQQQRESLPYFPEVAIKIFKTTLNEFKNRHLYMEGDHRFNKFNKQNPRKMIKLWAEKEMRNLKRVAKVESIRAPVPVLLREHILVMQFIGEDGKHAPQLKEANLSPKQYKRAYIQVVKMMRDLFHQCGLIHSDLSEFNLLYFKKNVYVIDFAAAVETEAPNSLDFLRNDCSNVTRFFQKQGCNVMSEKDLFTFVTDPSIENLDDYIESSSNKIKSEGIDEMIFKQTFIPVNLSQISDPFEGTHVEDNNFLKEMLKDN